MLLEKAHAAFNASNLTDVLSPNTSSQTTTQLVTTVIGWVIFIAGILAFFYLVYSGILYVTAAGNPEQAKKGQQGLINAVIGIIVIVLAYVILTAIAGTANGTAPIGG